MFAEEFPRRPMRSLIAIERDLMRQLALALERTAEERFGRRDITLGAEQEINSLSLLVNGAIDVSPRFSNVVRRHVLALKPVTAPASPEVPAPCRSVCAAPHSQMLLLAPNSSHRRSRSSSEGEERFL